MLSHRIAAQAGQLRLKGSTQASEVAWCCPTAAQQLGDISFHPQGCATIVQTEGDFFRSADSQE
jgi:hypothetical protein